ncbi:MAG TPA: hypothetical protein VMT16_03855, partial [Thermoanaerobaculia bacterium]|nr:hypothetical protein [Thermoanaerobaculia bacterium]
DGVSLVDTASGNRVASLAAPERTALRAARFLADGRLLLAESRRGRVAVRIFDAAGVPQRQIDVGGGRWPWLGGEWAPGRVTLGMRTTAGHARDPGGWRTLSLDVETATVTPLAGGLRPAVAADDPFYGRRVVAPPPPGSPATRLFLELDGHRLVRLDPATGERQVLLPAP